MCFIFFIYFKRIFVRFPSSKILYARKQHLQVNFCNSNDTIVNTRWNNKRSIFIAIPKLYTIRVNTTTVTVNDFSQTFNKESKQAQVLLCSWNRELDILLKFNKNGSLMKKKKNRSHFIIFVSTPYITVVINRKTLVL